MWNTSQIAGPLHIPAQRDSAGNVIAWHPGYHLLVGDAVVTPEVAPFIASYAETPLVFAGVTPTYLTFADEAEAREIIPTQWQTPTLDPDSGYKPVPAFVTPRQMRLALVAAGLYEAVQQFTATQDAETQIAWEYATLVERNDPLITLAVTAMGWSEEQADDLFRAAAAL